MENPISIIDFMASMVVYIGTVRIVTIWINPRYNMFLKRKYAASQAAVIETHFVAGKNGDGFNRSVSIEETLDLLERMGLGENKPKITQMFKDQGWEIE